MTQASLLRLHGDDAIGVPVNGVERLVDSERNLQSHGAGGTGAETTLMSNAVPIDDPPRSWNDSAEVLHLPSSPGTGFDDTEFPLFHTWLPAAVVELLDPSFSWKANHEGEIPPTAPSH